jgi:hypothetical protein
LHSFNLLFAREQMLFDLRAIVAGRLPQTSLHRFQQALANRM